MEAELAWKYEAPKLLLAYDRLFQGPLPARLRKPATNQHRAPLVPDSFNRHR